MRGRILIIDPDEALHQTLELWLSSEAYEVASAQNAAGALAETSRTAFDVVLCDYDLTDRDEKPLLPLLVRRLPETTVVALSPPAKDERARAILEFGVYDCVTKPPVQLELVMSLRRAEERQQHRREASLLQRDIQRLVGDRPLVAASPRMIQLLEATERVAGEASPALLVGEGGAGKEIVARAIHAQSSRRRAQFAVVPCRGIGEYELDALLFGHARDAAPGGARVQRGLLTEADGGTVYFDEIAALPASTQLKLLTLLQDGEIRALGDAASRAVDLRVLAGTSHVSPADGRSQGLHPELLAHLEENVLCVPALRERRQDIPLLVDHFFARAREIHHKPLRAIADDVLERLVRYPWPGNIHELENVVHRAVMIADGDRVTMRQLPEDIASPSSPAATPVGPRLGLKRARKQLEAELIRQALKDTGGNRTHAARLLEISHRALLYKLKEYGITN